MEHASSRTWEQLRFSYNVSCRSLATWCYTSVGRCTHASASIERIKYTSDANTREEEKCFTDRVVITSRRKPPKANKESLARHPAPFLLFFQGFNNHNNMRSDTVAPLSRRFRARTLSNRGTVCACAGSVLLHHCDAPLARGGNGTLLARQLAGLHSYALLIANFQVDKINQFF